MERTSVSFIAISREREKFVRGSQSTTDGYEGGEIDGPLLKRGGKEEERSTVICRCKNRGEAEHP